MRLRPLGKKQKPVPSCLKKIVVCIKKKEKPKKGKQPHDLGGGCF
jgi:hypothetical protein